jgi:hypothetical protein
MAFAFGCTTVALFASYRALRRPARTITTYSHSTAFLTNNKTPGADTVLLLLNSEFTELFRDLWGLAVSQSRIQS